MGRGFTIHYPVGHGNEAYTGEKLNASHAIEPARKNENDQRRKRYVLGITYGSASGTVRGILECAGYTIDRSTPAYYTTPVKYPVLAAQYPSLPLLLHIWNDTGMGADWNADECKRIAPELVTLCQRVRMAVRKVDAWCAYDTDDNPVDEMEVEERATAEEHRIGYRYAYMLMFSEAAACDATISSG